MQTDPKNRADAPRGRTCRRVLCGLLTVFVCAGIAAITVFMVVLLPTQYRAQALQVCVPLQNAQVGESVLFGAYEQNNDRADDAESIEWVVLSRQDDSLFLLSRYALDCKQYNNADAFATWDNSTILRWLNDTFYNTAFDGAEKVLILSSEVDVDYNPYFDTRPGSKTVEKVFLMSISEIYKYLGDEATRQCTPTAYAIAQGLRVDASGKCMWWLRTPGYDASAATRVLMDGTINYCGYRVHSDFNAVRPCIRVSLRGETTD